MEDILRFLCETGLYAIVLEDSKLVSYNVGIGPRIVNKESFEDVRTRQIVPYLLEDILGHKDALPAKVFTEKYEVVKYPYSVVKKKSYSQLGLEMEALVLNRLRSVYSTKFEGMVDEISEISGLSPKERQTFTPEIEKGIGLVCSYFRTNYPAANIHKIVAGLVFSYTDAKGNKIVGHPDLVIYLSPSKIVIFDVKVFAKMDLTKSREIKAQISMYVALSRSQGLECSKVGVIMPWLRDDPVKVYNVDKWKSDYLLETSVVCAEKVRREPQHFIKWTHLLGKFNVGSHVSKEAALSVIKSGGEEPRPFQIFLYGNNPSRATEEKGRILFKKNVKVAAFSNYNAFVHAPYNLNLASTDDYIANAAILYMQDAHKYGFKGVVFHTGHHSDATEGISNMKNNITKILKHVHPNTPFALETPCGNKNELLATPEAFAEFIMQFPEPLLGACLDSCHVFVSGYMPMDYIERMGLASDRIFLFHFNGSRKKHGCCADGHGHVTRIQNIPDEQLVMILDISKKWNIFAVTE